MICLYALGLALIIVGLLGYSLAKAADKKPPDDYGKGF